MPVASARSAAPMRIFERRLGLECNAEMQGNSNEYTLELFIPFSDAENRSRPWDARLPTDDMLTILGTGEPRYFLCSVSLPLGADQPPDWRSSSRWARPLEGSHS